MLNVLHAMVCMRHARAFASAALRYTASARRSFAEMWCIMTDDEYGTHSCPFKRKCRANPNLAHGTHATRFV